jgi:CheY-like chemotaxis protein
VSNASEERVPNEADVLIVEDEPVVRSVMERVLVEAGYEVQAVANGLEALAAVQDRSYRAVVCDIKMPLVDGPKFYGQLASGYPALAKRVLFVTGVAGAPGITEFLRNTGCRVLWKPYEIRTFVYAVSELVGRLPSTGMFALRSS